MPPTLEMPRIRIPRISIFPSFLFPARSSTPVILSPSRLAPPSVEESTRMRGRSLKAKWNFVRRACLANSNFAFPFSGRVAPCGTVRRATRKYLDSTGTRFAERSWSVRCLHESKVQNCAELRGTREIYRPPGSRDTCSRGRITV